MDNYRKQDEQQFLSDLDKNLWTAADKLRANVDAAVYKHVVLGLIFLKYVSDAFKERHAELEASFHDPKHDYYLGDDADELIVEELEISDYYTEKNVFWVPALARWNFIRDNAKVADTFHAWKKGAGYEDIPGFCKTVTIEKIKKHDFVLTPGRYVGAPPQEDDGEPFEEKMIRLTAALKEQFAEGARLEAEIRKNLTGLGYEL